MPLLPQDNGGLAVAIPVAAAQNENTARVNALVRERIEYFRGQYVINYSCSGISSGACAIVVLTGVLTSMDPLVFLSSSGILATIALVSYCIKRRAQAQLIAIRQAHPEAAGMINEILRDVE